MVPMTSSPKLFTTRHSKILWTTLEEAFDLMNDATWTSFQQVYFYSLWYIAYMDIPNSCRGFFFLWSFAHLVMFAVALFAGYCLYRFDIYASVIVVYQHNFVGDSLHPCLKSTKVGRGVLKIFIDSKDQENPEFCALSLILNRF